MLIKYSTYIRNYFETHQLEAWIPVLNKNATPGPHSSFPLHKEPGRIPLAASGSSSCLTLKINKLDLRAHLHPSPLIGKASSLILTR